MVDFIPATDAYEVASTPEAVDDQQWTEPAVAGRNEGLDSLRTALTGEESA